MNPGRIAAAQRRLSDTGLDALLLSVGADLPYLTGYEAMALERLTMLVLTSDRAILVVPRLEAPRVEAGEFETLAWDETNNPLDIIAGLLGPKKRVAIGSQTWSVFLLGLQERMTETTFVSADPIMAELRIRKSPAEIEALAEVGKAADRVARRLTRERFSGRTERQLSRLVVAMMEEEGHEKPLFWIVASGPNGASPHHEPGDRTLAVGDVVVVDFGGLRSGYCSDTTRTFVVGEPTAEQVEVHRVVAEAQRAASDAVRPGVTAESIDAVGRAVIEGAGYGDFFIHRIGHGIGREVHEHPYLVEGNDRLLEAGMCFSIEPGVYLPGRFGVRIEDIVVVTDDGHRALNQSDRGLILVD